MAAGISIKHKRKAGAFANGELAAGEFGVDTSTGNLYYSLNGSTVINLDARFQAANANLTTWAGKTAPDGAVLGTTDAQIVTNKRQQKRVYSTTTTATLTPEIDTYDVFELTAQNQNLTIANHSTSTPVNREMILIIIKDNSASRTITYGTNYVDGNGATRPTATTAGKEHQILFQWSSSLSKYKCLAAGVDA